MNETTTATPEGINAAIASTGISAGADEVARGVTINLLPWRARQRERRSRQFLVVIVSCALLGLGVGWGHAEWVQQALEAQQQRLAHIKDRTAALERDIQAVQALEQRRNRLQGRITLIRRLEFSRPQTVRIFDALTTRLVAGVYFDRVVRHEGRLDISALARTNRQVSDQMRAIAAASALGEPQLLDVRAAEGESGVRRFNLSVPVRLRETDTAEEG